MSRLLEFTVSHSNPARMLSSRSSSVLRSVVISRSVQRFPVAFAHTAAPAASSFAEGGGFRKALFGVKSYAPSTVSATIPHCHRSAHHHKMLPFEIAKVFDVLDSLSSEDRRLMLLYHAYEAATEAEEVTEGDMDLFADFRRWASTLATKDTIDYFDAALSESGIDAEKHYRPWVEMEEIIGETWAEMKLKMGMIPEADEQEFDLAEAEAEEERPMKSVEGDEEAVNAAWPHEAQPDSTIHSVTIERHSERINDLMSYAIEKGLPYKSEETFTMTRPGPDGETTTIKTSRTPSATITHIEGPEADEFDDPEDDLEHSIGSLNRISMIVKSPYPIMVDTGDTRMGSALEPNEDGDYVLNVERSGRDSPITVRIKEGHADEFPFGEEEHNVVVMH